MDSLLSSSATETAPIVHEQIVTGDGMVDYGQGFHLGPEERLGAFAVLVSALGSSSRPAEVPAKRSRSWSYTSSGSASPCSCI